jgi:hypothetical protein
MKFLALFMLLAFAVCEPVAQAQWSNGNTEELSPKEKRKQAKQEAKQARKEAAQYYKEYIVKKRKALILVKKIEDERSRNASIRSFKLLFEEEEEDEELGSDRTIGGGGYGNGGGVSEKAKNKAMEAERKKYEKAIKKIDDQIDAEVTRIEEAELMTDELSEFVKKAKE